MKTVPDILYIMREIYRVIWCHGNGITCKQCKHEDACIILCHAIGDFIKDGEYH